MIFLFLNFKDVSKNNLKFNCIIFVNTVNYCPEKSKDVLMFVLTILKHRIKKIIFLMIFPIFYFYFKNC
jgi:hypothetical protein